MRPRTVARIYAVTLLRLAERAGAVETVDEGVAAVSAVLAEDSRFARFLEAPHIAAAEKRAVLEQAFGDKLHPMLLKFLLLVVEKRREPLLGEIAATWKELLDERAQRMTARLVTAVPVDEEIHEAVRAALERATGKHVTLEHDIEPAMIGGVVVRYGDKVVDGSVRRRLSELGNRLRHAHVAG